MGNIYKGVVENVLPGMQAAFVDIGIGANAILPFSEIESDSLLLDQDDDDHSDSKSKDQPKGRSQGRHRRKDTRASSFPKTEKPARKFWFRSLKNHTWAKVPESPPIFLFRDVF